MSAPQTDRIDARLLLRRFLDECEKCREMYKNALIGDQRDMLDEQTEAMFVYLYDLHIKLEH